MAVHDALFGGLFDEAEKAVIKDALRAANPNAPELKPAVAEPLVRETGEVSQEPIKSAGKIQNTGIVAHPNTKELAVPVMTAEETNANVPPNGKQMVRVRAPKGVALATFRLVVSNAFALHQLTGKFSVETLSERTNLTPGAVSKVVTNPEFKVAMETRGVPVDSRLRGLTVEQEQALIVLTDPTMGHLKQKLKKLGWSYSKYKAQMRTPAFAEQMRGVTEQTLANNEDSLVVLESLVLNGDLNALKYKHILNGTYDPNRQTNIDIVAVISTVFEVVSRHVKDAEALEAVATELGGLARGLNQQPQQRILEN